MGHINRCARSAVLGASVTLLSLVATHTAPAEAAKKPQAPAAANQAVDPAAQKQKEAAASRSAFENGIKDYQAGKYAQASENLSAALRVGGLSAPEMARALYYRGLSYKKQSKPGLAISDLTSALWLKDGLNDADRKAATSERAEAYRMAGLNSEMAPDSAVAADPNVTAASASPAAAAAAPTKASNASKTVSAVPAPIPEAAPASVITRQSPDSEAAQDAARARKLASTPVDAQGIQSAAAATVVGGGSSAPAPVLVPASQTARSPLASLTGVSATPVLSAAPIDSAPPAGAKPAEGAATNPITGFFSNLFSSGASKTEAQAPVTTASTAPPQTSSWNNQTSVVASPVKGTTPAKQLAASAVAAAPAPALKGGKYKIHIAAVRSRQEAEAIAQRLQVQSGAALNSRAPIVDEAVIGSMGTFYRVRVGSYATADEPRAVCNTLRSSGFDCLVVTN